MSEASKAAAQALIDCQWPEGTVASHMTCIEASTIADFIAEELGQEAAAIFIQAHSVGDGESDLHYEIGRITRERGIGWKEPQNA